MRKVGQRIVDKYDESKEHPIIPKEKEERKTPIDYARSSAIVGGGNPILGKKKVHAEA